MLYLGFGFFIDESVVQHVLRALYKYKICTFLCNVTSPVIASTAK